MTQEELINVFKYIVKKCDILINNGDYVTDAYKQDTVEDIAELCNHILDGDYGKLVEVKEVDFKKEFSQWWKGERTKDYNVDILYERYSNVSMKLAKHFFELGMQVSNKAQKEE